MKDFVSGKDTHMFPITSSAKKATLNDLLTDSHLSCSNITQVKAKR